MENNEMAMRTNDIIESIAYFRLLTSLGITQSSISKNVIEAEDTNSNIFKKGFVRTKNALTQATLDNLEKEKTKTEATIQKFKRNSLENTIYQYGESEETLKNELNDFLKDDHDDYLKYQVALTCILDNRYSHAHEDETMKKLSSLMFGDQDRLNQLKKMIKKNLRALLSDQQIEKVSKTILITLGVAIATTATVGGALAVGAMASPNVAQVLANIGHQAARAWGKGLAITVGKLALFAVTGGLIAVAARSAKDIYEDEKAYKEAIRAIKPDDLAATLAIRLTLVQLAKEKTSEDKLKEYKEAVLKDADYIRSDSEFLYIIEHNDERDSKCKAAVCNRAVECLAGI